MFPLAAVLVVSTCDKDCDGVTSEAVSETFGGTAYVNGAPRAGVTVAAGGERATTDESGRYSLSGNAIVTVTASAPGVTFLNNDAIVTLPRTDDVDFEGYTDAAVRGRVLIGGAPVAGARVRLDVFSGDSREYTTAADGRYEFTNVPPSELLGHSLVVTSRHPGVIFVELLFSIVLRGRDLEIDLTGIVTGVGIHGTVSWNGVGLPDVTVTATGPDVVTRVTDANGEYSTGSIARGDYTVELSGYDVAAYPFAVASQTIALDFGAQADFAGATNQLPVATILSPETGATGYTGASITFLGDGNDPDTGALPDTALAWSSSLDGALGTGRSVSSTLSVGTHTIALVATDAAGATDTARITIQVLEAPSNASISGRVTGNGYGVGDATMTLSGPVSATTTSGDGGAYAFTGLPPGTYTLTVSTSFAITFPNPSQTVTLAQGQALTVDFAGTYIGGAAH